MKYKHSVWIKEKLYKQVNIHPDIKWLGETRLISSALLNSLIRYNLHCHSLSQIILLLGTRKFDNIGKKSIQTLKELRELYFKDTANKMNLGTGDFQTTHLMRQYINEVLSSNRLSYGPFSKQFENDFANLHDCKYGVLSNSGTSSLLVALQTLKELHGWNDGDEVIVPALTFVATVNIVLQCNLKPVLVDVEPDYYCLDVVKINKYIQQCNITKRKQPVAIIPVHLFGLSANMSPIFSIANHSGLKIIEDSCETILATYHNHFVGSWGDIACFSFYNAHHLTTGIGGMSITDNQDYAIKMRSLVNHGLEYEQLSKTGEYDPMMLSRNFRFNSVGHSFRITELEAAIGLAQMETLRNDIKQRQDNAAYMIDSLQELEDKEYLQLPHARPRSTHSYMMFPVVLKKETKYGLMKHLTDNGIGVRDMMPLTNQPVYKGMFNENDYPVAKWINEHGLYWGCHQYLKREQLDYVIEKVHEYF